jgi:[CysO sulfur-carrier protein]-S-L-cysteine hydrolase
MQLIMPRDIKRRISGHLVRARKREIGGMLMGEEIGDQTFRIVDFTVDPHSGSNNWFSRHAELHDKELQAFFEKTGGEYQRYNYLGEWHSHPSFTVNPSRQDLHSMQRLVEDSEGVSFAVLLITRFGWFWRFQCNALLFVRSHAPTQVEVRYEK